MYVFIQQGDTLPTLAQKYLGDSTQADLLASVNNLEYPFVVGIAGFVKSVYATGNVTVTLTDSTSTTLPIGTIFKTSSGSSSEVRQYTSTAEVTLTNKGQSATVPVQCTQAGHYGNVLAYSVTSVSGFSNVSVANPSAISGGKIFRVLIPGDKLLIPDTSTQTNTTSRLSLSQYDALGGTDLTLTSTGGLLFSSDDLIATTGAQTVGTDIAATIATPLGSDPTNPTFGSLVPSSIGMGGEYSMQRAAVLAQGVASADNRVQSAGSVSMAVMGTFLSIDLPVELNNGQSSTVSTAIAGGGA